MKRIWLLFIALFAGIIVSMYHFRSTGVFRPLITSLLQTSPVKIPGLPACPDCNILLVNLDTLRADEMECYGYIKTVTPNLCKFADNNILFRRFYDNTSFTLDSHMAIFTGLYPTSHHVLDALKDSLSPAIPTLAELLHANGYHTTWVGMTNDVNMPLDKGFGRGYDEIVSLTAEDSNWEKRYQEELFPRLSGNRPAYIFFHTYGPHAPYLPGKGPYRFITDETTKIPLTKDEYYANTPAFYRYVIQNFEYRVTKSTTKESIQHNQEVIRKLSSALGNNDMAAASQVMGDMPIYESYDQYIGWYWANIDGTDPHQRNLVQNIYDERLYQLDQQIAPLLEFLEKPEIKRKTIVVFLSDNGEDLMEHGKFDHGWNIYNTGTHAPFVLGIPRVGRGVYHELAEAVDIFPTLLDLIGIKTTKPIDGISLVPIVEGRGEQQVGMRYIIGEHHGDMIQSIRNERWKLYKNRTPNASYVELFDLMTDRLEQKNVVGQHFDIARQLDAALKRTLDASPQYASNGGEFPAWVDEEKRKSLINEGYF